MKLPKAASTISLACALTACVVVPVVDRYDDTPSTCKTYTRSMSLKAVEMTPNNARCNDEACFAVVLAISAGSVLISGSIVLTGNTIHWLEYQGTCSDGYLNAVKEMFLKTSNKPKAASEI
ncbi:MAG: hypothetical protein KKH12_03790 [Gammaproteobacteria bacterium]|nr:hypothetical protein [Gammaproteobacteria bacterium]MBU1480778.1 hypothetical protein [Gammaproteobacteria bacterium]